MHHLLAVSGIFALVRVVADQSLLVHHQEGLPDRCQAVVGASFTTGGNVRDKLPRHAGVARGIEFNVRGGEIGRDGRAGDEDRSSRVTTNASRQDVEKRLVAQAVPVLGILDTRDFLPCLTTVDRLVNGKVDFGRFRRVVLPCCKERAVAELGTAGIQDLRVSPASVPGRRKNDVIGECRLRQLELGEGSSSGRGHAGERQEES